MRYVLKRTARSLVILAPIIQMIRIGFSDKFLWTAKVIFFTLSENVDLSKDCESWLRKIGSMIELFLLMKDAVLSKWSGSCGLFEFYLR